MKKRVRVYPNEYLDKKEYAVTYFMESTIAHIPRLTWRRNYRQFPLKEKYAARKAEKIARMYFRLLFKFIIDEGRHVKLPKMLGYIGLFKFVPKKEFITDFDYYRQTGKERKIRNNRAGAFKHKLKWYRMGDNSTMSLVKVTPDYKYTFVRSTHYTYLSYMMNHTDVLIKYPIIQSSKIVSAIQQNKIKI